MLIFILQSNGVWIPWDMYAYRGFYFQYTDAAPRKVGDIFMLESDWLSGGECCLSKRFLSL